MVTKILYIWKIGCTGSYAIAFKTTKVSMKLYMWSLKISITMSQRRLNFHQNILTWSWKRLVRKIILMWTWPSISEKLSLFSIWLMISVTIEKLFYLNLSERLIANNTLIDTEKLKTRCYTSLTRSFERVLRDFEKSAVDNEIFRIESEKRQNLYVITLSSSSYTVAKTRTLPKIKNCLKASKTHFKLS